MTDVQGFYAYLKDQEAMLARELERYVTIESGSRDKAGVDRVGHVVSEAFSALGFTIERIAETECGDHLIARRSGGGVGRLLALIHLDTVWPPGSLATNPFRVEAWARLWPRHARHEGRLGRPACRAPSAPGGGVGRTRGDDRLHDRR